MSAIAKPGTLMIQVTAAIITDTGKILIAKRKSTARLPNLWEFPGGKMEPGESAEQCLKRELYEEFEIHVRIGQCVGANIHAYDFGTIELIAFKASLVGGKFKLHDHAEIRWVQPNDLDHFTFTPADSPFVDMLRRGEIAL
jgi:8-oxo-dGTP diphosphatase